MEDERDAEDAIRALDRIEFGRKGRRLRVEWTKQEHGSRKPAEGGRGGGGGSRRSSSDLKPSKTLFVINFDPQETRTKDLERHFEPYGKIASVRIRRNFAFVQYEHLEDATEALHATNKTDLLDRVISVEYAVRDDDERRDGNGSDRGGDRYRSSPPDRRRGRSPTSPYRRERGSPDYGRGGSRGSPDYGRGGGNRRKEERVTPPDYAPPRRGGSSPSPPPPPPLPPPHKRGERPSSDVRRERRSRSPYGGGAPENGGRDQSPLPYDRKRPRRGNRSQSPYDDEEEERDNGRRRRVTKDSPAAAAEDNKPYSPDNGAEPTIGGGADSPANGRDHSISPAQED